MQDIGIGTRAGYYDGIGAARDVIQNHLLQLLALTAMEEADQLHARGPAHREGEGALGRPARQTSHRHRPRAVRRAGWQGGEHVDAFLQEQGIPEGSATETFAAMKLFVDTRRWADVPFYLRTGKRLGKRVTEIAVIFNRAAHVPSPPRRW